MDDGKATRELAILNVLVDHTGEMLTPDCVERIAREINDVMATGPEAWAFGAPPPEGA